MNGVHDMGGMDGFGPATARSRRRAGPDRRERSMNGVHDMDGMDGFDPAEREAAVEPAPTGGSGT